MLTKDVGACWAFFLPRGQRYHWLCMTFRSTGFGKVKLFSEVWICTHAGVIHGQHYDSTFNIYSSLNWCNHIAWPTRVLSHQKNDSLVGAFRSHNTSDMWRKIQHVLQYGQFRFPMPDSISVARIRCLIIFRSVSICVLVLLYYLLILRLWRHGP